MSKIIYSIPSWDNWISLATLRNFIDQTEHLDGSERVQIVGKTRIVEGELQMYLSPSKLEKLTPKNGNSTGGHLHFTAGPFKQVSEEELADEIEKRKRRASALSFGDRRDTEPTHKIRVNDLPPRDNLGRFTKRKSHYSDYLTDD